MSLLLLRPGSVDGGVPTATTRQTQPSPIIRDEVANPRSETIAASSGPRIV